MNKKSIITGTATAILLSVSLFTAYASTLSILPTSDGTYTSWTPKSGTTHYTMVDETVCNGTTDYVSTNTVGARDSYSVNLSGVSDGSTITSIALKPCASRNASGSGTSVMNIFYRLNGTDSADSGAYNPTGTTPVGLATTTFSGLSIIKSSTSTLQIGAVYTSGTKGVRLSKLATVVTYTPAPINFSIVSSAGANGSISPTGTTTVTQGNNQTFTITPNANYKTSSVLVNGSSTNATSSYTFTNVQANQTISATFTPITYVINASAGPNGFISSAGTSTVTQGGGKFYSITATTTYMVADVLIDGVSIGATTSYMFNNVQANHTISATFTQ